MDFLQLLHNQRVGLAAENFGQGLHDVALHRHPQPEVAHGDKGAGVAGGGIVFEFLRKLRQIIGQRGVQIVQQPLPTPAYGIHMRQGVLGALAQQLFAGQVGAHFINRQFGFQVAFKGIAQSQLVLNR